MSLCGIIWVVIKAEMEAELQEARAHIELCRFDKRLTMELGLTSALHVTTASTAPSTVNTPRLPDPSVSTPNGNTVMTTAPSPTSAFAASGVPSLTPTAMTMERSVSTTAITPTSSFNLPASARSLTFHPQLTRSSSLSLSSTMPSSLLTMSTSNGLPPRPQPSVDHPSLSSTAPISLSRSRTPSTSSMSAAAPLSSPSSRSQSPRDPYSYSYDTSTRNGGATPRSSVNIGSATSSRHASPSPSPRGVALTPRLITPRSVIHPDLLFCSKCMQSSCIVAHHCYLFPFFFCIVGNYGNIRYGTCT
jgi:hypothetical protein